MFEKANIMPTIMHLPLPFENALLLIRWELDVTLYACCGSTFACKISLQASCVYRLHLAETNKNFTLARVFVAYLAGFSNDFSSELERDQ